MDWKKLVSDKRYSHRKQPLENGRSQFHKDFDRIVFSTSFRRLGRKTQVHPLTINDHVHTRLTHSIEVSSVGRSLAMLVHQKLGKRIPATIGAHHFGTIVQSACLSHDIGNPPFGHAGESAIQDWFKRHTCEPFANNLKSEEISDFLNFDGNAQGFRILTKLEYNPNAGGMRLTFATLGTMVKYPCLSLGKTKFSVFNSEKDIFEELFTNLGIPRKGQHLFGRHPLSYLMEAADDICYALMDIEDAVELGMLNYQDVKSALAKIYGGKTQGAFKSSVDFRGFLSSIRGRMISNLIEDVSKTFVNKYVEIMDGALDKDLISSANFTTIQGLELAKKIAKEKVFKHRRKIELEIGSYTMISSILDAMVPTIYSHKVEKISNFKTSRIMDLLGKYAGNSDISLLEMIHTVTDFISGMTDNYAAHISKQISGHGL